jgi:hypothetical protein
MDHPPADPAHCQCECAERVISESPGLGCCSSDTMELVASSDHWADAISTGRDSGSNSRVTASRLRSHASEPRSDRCASETAVSRLATRRGPDRFLADTTNLAREPTIYLVDERDDPADEEACLQAVCSTIFEDQLDGWWRDRINGRRYGRCPPSGAGLIDSFIRWCSTWRTGPSSKKRSRGVRGRSSSWTARDGGRHLLSFAHRTFMPSTRVAVAGSLRSCRHVGCVK